MVNLETEAEPEHKLTIKLSKTVTKTNLFLELVFKIPLVELQKPRQFSSSLSQGYYILDRTLFQILTSPTMFLSYAVSLFAGKSFSAVNRPLLFPLLLNHPI